MSKKMMILLVLAMFAPGCSYMGDVGRGFKEMAVNDELRAQRRQIEHQQKLAEIERRSLDERKEALLSKAEALRELNATRQKTEDVQSEYDAFLDQLLKERLNRLNENRQND